MRIEEYAKRSAEELSSLLRESAGDFAAFQEASLMDILDSAKDTEYGRKYNFASIRRVAEYQKRVPTTEFADYEVLVERIMDGEADILFPGQPVCVVHSSGTGGKLKPLPESVAGNQVKILINRMRSAEISRILGDRRNADFRIFAVTNSSSIFKTKLGIPVGSASGLALTQAGHVASRLSVPLAFSRQNYLSNDEMNYAYAFFALRDEKVRELTCNNVAHFMMILEIINTQTERLLDDLARGEISAPLREAELQELDLRPDPERAEHLRTLFRGKGKLEVSDFWPEFACVGTWLSSSAGRVAKEYEKAFPAETVFIHWGYGASESKFDVPVEPGKPDGIPVAFGSFMELRDPETENILLPQEAVPGKPYELIVTSYSGLYRYELHDLVRLSKGADELPRIEFICRTKERLRFGDRFLYAGELTDMVEAFEERTGRRLVLFQGREADGKLALSVEPQGELDLPEFEAFMREKLEAAGVPLSAVSLYPKGYRNSLLVRVVDGQAITDTKVPVFPHA